MADFPTLFDAIKGLGIAGGPVFAILWWLERVERKECQGTIRDLLTQVLTVTSQATMSVTTVTTAVSELRAVMNSSTTSLSQLIRSIKRGGS